MQNEQLKTILYEYANTKGVGLPLTAEQCLNAMSSWLVNTLPECIDVITETLNPGSEATVTLTGSGTPDDHYVFTFGIPEGIQGEQGIQGKQGIQGEKGDTGDIGYNIWASNIEPFSYVGTYNLALNSANLYGYSDRSQQVNDLVVTPSGLIYQIMVVDGNVLEVTYRTSIKGATGATGATGAQGKQGLSGLSIYDMAAQVTTSGTTVTVDVFTVPSGFTVQVGDLVIGTDGILGQVSAISGSNYNIRYILNLLLSSDSYVTLTSNQTISGNKSFVGVSGYSLFISKQGGETLYFPLLTVTLKPVSFNLNEKFYFTGSLYGDATPFYVVLSVTDGNIKVFTTIKNSKLKYYVEDSTVTFYLEPYVTYGNFRMWLGEFYGNTTYISTIEYPGNTPEAVDLPDGAKDTDYIEIGLFRTGTGLTYSHNDGTVLSVDTDSVALKTDIPTIPSLYNYKCFIRAGFGSSSTNSLVATFEFDASESLGLSDDNTTLQNLYVIAEYIWNHFVVNDNSEYTGYGVPCNGTLYLTSTELSYMTFRITAESEKQLMLFYISSDKQAVTSSIQVTDDTAFTLSSNCSLGIDATYPDGTHYFFNTTLTT